MAKKIIQTLYDLGSKINPFKTVESVPESQKSTTETSSTAPVVIHAEEAPVTGGESQKSTTETSSTAPAVIHAEEAPVTGGESHGSTGSGSPSSSLSSYSSAYVPSSSSSFSSSISSGYMPFSPITSLSSSSSESSTVTIIDKSFIERFDGDHDAKLIFNPFTIDMGPTKGLYSSSSEYTLTFNTDYLRTSGSTEDSREKSPESGKCNNFCSRATGSEIRYIMQHYTVSDLKVTFQSFLSGSVSSHYVVNVDGTIYTMVDPKYKAYHAGTGQLKAKSFLNPYEMGKDAMNSWSIGISNVNDGRSSFTLDQIKANVHLLEFLVKEYHVFPKQIIAHADWTPGRHINPGPYFPWKTLSLSSKTFAVEHNFGSYYHKPLKKDSDIIASSTTGSKEDVEYIQQNLSKFGYVVPGEGDLGFGIYGESTERAVLSFSLHYMQGDIVENSEKMKVWDILWSTNGETRASRVGLQEWTENHEATMIGLLDEA